MFFVLQRKDDKVFLKTRNVDTGETVTTTTVINEAKLFKLKIEVDHHTTQTEKTTSGVLFCELENDKIPMGLPGTWELVPVELRLV